MLSARDLVEQMSADMGMLPEHLMKIVRTAPIRYKVFHIEKRSGGLREVAQPAREVKAIQRWLVQRLEPILPVHPAATAYRRGASIRLNAARHIDAEFILKMDFENFFPSITSSDIEDHLSRHCEESYDRGAIRLIAFVTTWARNRQPPLRLCIGAPSSPLLSNSIMYEFDSCLFDRAIDDDVVYTRYADDITLSSRTPRVVEKYKDIVAKIADQIVGPHLRVNDKKTVLGSRAGRMSVTGINLTPEHKLSVGRERKRLVRAMFHRYVHGQLTPEEQEKLFGLIAFIEDIEPGFYKRLRK